MEIVPLGPGFAAELRGMTLRRLRRTMSHTRRRARLSRNIRFWFFAAKRYLTRSN